MTRPKKLDNPYITSEMKRLYYEKKLTYREIASLFDISHSLVYTIINKR